MIASKRMLRAGVAALLTGTLLVGGPLTSAYAATGAVRIQAGHAGFIVGVGGGSGTLRFHGKTYRLRVGGVSLGTFGASTATLVGRAYHMRSASDIAGTYSSVGAGVAIVGGVRVARLQNAKGVVLELRGPQAGLEASLNLSGINIALE